MIEFHLKDVLNNISMSMSELSKATGISRTSLSQLSTGKSRGIQFNTLEKIILATNCTVDDLIVFKPDIKNMVIVNKVDDSKKIIECEIFNPNLSPDTSSKEIIKVDYQIYQQGIIFNLNNENGKKIDKIFIKFLGDNHMIDFKKINHTDMGNEVRRLELFAKNLDTSKKETYVELSSIQHDIFKKLSEINISNQIYDLFSKQLLVQLTRYTDASDFNYSTSAIYIFNWERIIDDKRFNERLGEKFINTSTISSDDVNDYYLSIL